MRKKVISKSCSMQGWEFGKFAKGLFWLIKGKWGTIKEIGKLVAPLVLGYIATKNPAAIAGITVIGKAVLDIAEYFFKEKTV